MKRKTRIHIALMLLIAVLAVMCGLKLRERSEHLKKYETMPTAAAESTAAAVTETVPGAGDAVQKPVDPDAARVIDFAALKERNPDVVAWIYIPGTVINYPILWMEKDNDYYLRRDIDLRQGSYDGVYLDGWDNGDFSRLHNLVYGHHMKNRTMFTQICDFKDEAFFKEHQRVYLYTPDHTYVLKPMACLYTDAGPERRRMDFTDRMEFDAYVDQMTKDCKFRDLPVGGIDRLFAFVTCSYEFSDARTILYCYEVDENGDPVKPKEIPAEEKADAASGTTAAAGTAENKK